jgi:hypothetical protein
LILEINGVTLPRTCVGRGICNSFISYNELIRTNDTNTLLWIQNPIEYPTKLTFTETAGG